MKLRLVTLLTAFAIVLTAPTTAFAWGEIFPIKVTGWEYCSNGEANRLTNRTAMPVWIWLASGDEMFLSTSPNFPEEQTFPLFFEGAVPFRSNRVAVIASVAFEDGSYTVVTGYLYIDKRNGGWKSFKGTFIQNGTFLADCFSSGKLRTGKRMN
jgi:hypothetical protein